MNNANWMGMVRRAAMVALAVGMLSACGSEAKLGESCDKPSGDGECESGLVCTNNSGGSGNTCRKACTQQSDCAMTESCNGVSGGSLKSCQPN